MQPNYDGSRNWPPSQGRTYLTTRREWKCSKNLSKSPKAVILSLLLHIKYLSSEQNWYRRVQSLGRSIQTYTNGQYQMDYGISPAGGDGPFRSLFKHLGKLVWVFLTEEAQFLSEPFLGQILSVPYLKDLRKQKMMIKIE